VSPVLWVLFGVLVLGILAFDLGVLSRRVHLPSAKEALLRTALFVALSLAFAPVVWFLYEHHDFGAGGAERLDGTGAMVAYLTAWLLEQSLSLDNIFVIALIFGYFRVPSCSRRRNTSTRTATCSCVGRGGCFRSRRITTRSISS